MRYDFDLEGKKKIRKKVLIKILITVIEVCLVILIGYFITHHGMVIFTVSGQDMNPTLQKDDKILVNRISYHLHGVKRNDVIVTKQGGSEHNYYSVERVIGLPGEKIQIKDGEVYIDGEKLKEKYNYEKMENGGLALEEIILDRDEYFVLCDNRNNGEDSRYANIGNISKENIIGKAWIRINTMELISFLDEFKKQDDEDNKENYK